MKIGEKNKDTAITVLRAFICAIRKTGQINVRMENEKETIEYIDMAIDALGNQKGGWIPCSERLPTKEESIKNDNRFILDDGNRRYGGLFDYEKQCFVQFDFWKGLVEDKCVIAWQPLPEAYHG